MPFYSLSIIITLTKNMCILSICSIYSTSITIVYTSFVLEWPSHAYNARHVYAMSCRVLFCCSKRVQFRRILCSIWLYRAIYTYRWWKLFIAIGYMDSIAGFVVLFAQEKSLSKFARASLEQSKDKTPLTPLRSNTNVPSPPPPMQTRLTILFAI